jgi:hypothetical protein
MELKSSLKTRSFFKGTNFIANEVARAVGAMSDYLLDKTLLLKNLYDLTVDIFSVINI